VLMLIYEKTIYWNIVITLNENLYM
jgi:hypothetical protein